MSEADEVGDENGLGAMAEVVAPELFYIRFMTGAEHVSALTLISWKEG